MSVNTSIVVPTIGRPSLRALLRALAGGTEPLRAPVIVVDDRPAQRTRPDDDLAAELDDIALADLRVLRSGGGGPARARNIGWRHADTTWVSFLDDDVVPDERWYEDLLADLAAAPDGVAGSQGGVRVPLPTDRAATDWERSTAGLENAHWITADMSYRRAALATVSGFDERFPRAFREDADLGLRVTTSCGEITRGRRRVTHPVRPSDDWVSVRQQAGNRDDFLMRRLHGRHWRERAHAPRGRRARHLLTASSGIVALALAAAARPRPAALATAGWLVGTVDLATARIRPGPRDRTEVRRMLLTSAAIPFAASWHSVCGMWQHRRASPWRGQPDLVLFDRDGTLVHDVPYNGDPAQVRPLAGADEALSRLRSVGVRVGVVTNQSGVGSGRITAEQAAAVNARVEGLLGPFHSWQVCPHRRDEGCGCRKPAPGMVKAACEELGVEPARCVVVGDIGSDLAAADSAGASGILVPTPQTRRAEVSAAARVSPTIGAAVADIIVGRW